MNAQAIATQCTDDEPITVLNLLSTSFSGSTWLNLLLGSHSHLFSVGELKEVRKRGDWQCAVHGPTCGLWSQFEPSAPGNAFSTIAALSGRRVLVVNNSTKYFSSMDSEHDVRYLHLIRDGRAVCASYLRKNVGASMWDAARYWSKHTRRNVGFIRSIAPRRVFQLHYEHLVADVEGSVRRLCTWLNLNFEPTMTDIASHDHHYLGGNCGTLYGLLRERLVGAGSEASQHSTFDSDFYETDGERPLTDVRWKTELTTGQLCLFALVAGNLHRKLHYGSIFDRDSVPIVDGCTM